VFKDRVGNNSLVRIGNVTRPFPSSKVKPYPVPVHDGVIATTTSEDPMTLQREHEFTISSPLSGITPTEMRLSSSFLMDTLRSRLDLEQSSAAVTLLSEQLLNSAHSADDPRFTEGITAELRGLLSRGVFQLVPESALPRGSNVLGSRFRLTIKSANENIRYKARLVVQDHLDSEKGLIVPQAPTLSHTSMRIVLSIAALHGWHIWAKDVTMAYLQSESPLSRSVYIRPPKNPAFVTEQCSNRLLKVFKPLYGLVDSGSYWFATYTSY
jgi:hypothetical protein